MAHSILGRKLGMTQVWSDDDRLIPVTVIEAGPCVVSQVTHRRARRLPRRPARVRRHEGVTVEQAHDRVTSPRHAPSPKRFVREARCPKASSYKLGQKITVDGFEAGMQVHITGTSKGKGFQGVMKRHNFKGGPGGHGSHCTPRARFDRPGLHAFARASRAPGFPGHMGGDTVTIRKRRDRRVDVEQNLLLVKGAVPGGKNGLLTIRLG